MKDKNTKIQVLRGLAIIAVIMIHTCPFGMWQLVCRPFINFGGVDISGDETAAMN